MTQIAHFVHPARELWILVKSFEQDLIWMHVLMHLYCTIAFEVCCIWCFSSVELFVCELKFPVFEHLHKCLHLLLSLAFWNDEFSFSHCVIKHSINFPEIFENDFTCYISVSFCLKMFWFCEVLPFVPKRFIKFFDWGDKLLINKFKSLFFINTLCVNISNEPMVC